MPHSPRSTVFPSTETPGDAHPAPRHPDARSRRSISDLHEDLVALERELALSRERANHAWRPRAARGSRRAGDLARLGKTWVRALVTHLPGGLKTTLRNVLGHQRASGPVPAATAPVTVFPESAAAHRFLDGLAGIEIGASAHNPFHIPGCLNVDYTSETTVFTAEQLRISGEAARVDVVAQGDALPFPAASLGYVLSAHVLEHFYDPIGAIREWQRVVRPGGYILMIVPHRDRTFDRHRPLTSVDELFERHARREAAAAAGERIKARDAHHSVWVTRTFLDLCAALELRVVHVADVDDKVGNGFTVVVQR